MRRLAVIALALFLAGVAASGSAGRTTGSPISLGSLSEMSGAVAGGSGHGPQLVRFLPTKKFAVGLGTSYLFTVPGSRGDVCTRTGHALTFRSRALENDDRRPERVEIRFPHFAGEGTYRRAIATIVSGGKTAHRSKAVVTVTKATSHEVFAEVDAGQPPAGRHSRLPDRRLDALQGRQAMIRDRGRHLGLRG